MPYRHARPTYQTESAAQLDVVSYLSNKLAGKTNQPLNNQVREPFSPQNGSQIVWKRFYRTLAINRMTLFLIQLRFSNHPEDLPAIDHISHSPKKTT